MNHLEIAGTDISQWIHRAVMDGRALEFKARRSYLPQLEALLAQELHRSDSADFTFREEQKPYRKCGKIALSGSMLDVRQATFCFQLK